MTHAPMATVWDELGGDPALLPGVSTVARAGALEAALPVRELARACVGACALAAAELGARRAGLARSPRVSVDDGAVATAFVSERHLRIDGRAPVGFAPLSRFWRTADGWVRTHANYPHHRSRLLDALGAADDASAEDVASLLAGRSAREVEETVYSAGGLAVALRTPQEWAAHEQGLALARRPLIEWDGPAGGSGARPRVLSPLPAGAPLLPAAGVRVLDLTRVIAGPVATRTLALLGADVLRVDGPLLPEDPDAHADTGFGKRSTVLDLTADRRAFDELLASADVVVTGYRPGALDRFGLSPEALAERDPGLVVAQVSAWGTYGPWGGRRGFDSLVQVATGIAVTEGSPGRPGALPAQALDHGTGYLLAAAVLRALTERAESGRGRVVRLALARTAMWLTTGIERQKAPDATSYLSKGGPGATPDPSKAEPGAAPTTSPRTAPDPSAGRPGGAPTPSAGQPGGAPDLSARQPGSVPTPSAGQPGGVPDPSAGEPYDRADAWLSERAGPLGRLGHALPPVSFAGGPTDWSRPPGRWGTDPARWA
ncbi:CoA transferase [Streptomyces sp. NPDC005236]|uniref:CoA transferase n=1 Tax=Streptomyces sp. NPDC005236 TaxID=3157028 RepID=UPI0033AA57DA